MKCAQITGKGTFYKMIPNLIYRNQMQTTLFPLLFSEARWAASPPPGAAPESGRRPRTPLPVYLPTAHSSSKRHYLSYEFSRALIVGEIGSS